MTDVFNEWVETILPKIRTVFLSQAAKSRYFYDGDKKITMNFKDQSMFSHIFNAVSVAHSLIREMGLIEEGLLPAEDERLVYYTLTLHDLHKFERDSASRKLYGHDATESEYRAFADACGIPPMHDMTFARMKVCIDYHHRRSINPETRSKYPQLYPQKDPVFHLLKICDAVVSKTSVVSAYHTLEDEINKVQVDLREWGSIPHHFTYHIIPHFDGDLSLLIHHFVEEIAEGITPLLYFEDGTVYFSKTAHRFQHNIIELIAERLQEYLKDNMITFKFQVNSVVPNTKEYEINFPMERSWSQFVSNCREYITGKGYERAEEKYTLNLLSKGTSAQSKAIKEAIKTVPQFKEIYDALEMNQEKYAGYYFLMMARRMLEDYKLASVDDDTLMKLLGLETDTEVMKVLDIKDSGGGRNASWVQLYLFPLCDALYKKLYTPSMESREEYADALDSFFRARFDTLYNGWREKKLGDRGMTEKISGVLRGMVGFHSYPKAITDETFGLEAYTKCLENIDASETKITTFCFLCNSTNDLMKVNPDTAMMGLQIQTDRGASGKSINASKVKVICMKCWLRLLVRKKRYPYINQGNAGNAFYFVIQPDYLFTRDHTQLIADAFGGLVKMSDNDYKKWKKLEGDEAIGFMIDKTRMIQPYTVSRIAEGIIQNSRNLEILSSLFEMVSSVFPLWHSNLNDADLADLNLSTQSSILQNVQNKNALIFTALFSPDKENDTSRWYASSLLACIIHYTTGCRVTVTQDYGNIPLLQTQAIVSLDHPNMYAKKIFGSTMELAGGDIDRKFTIGAMLWYLNKYYYEETRNNSIAHHIGEYTTRPHKLIDLCYRYSEQKKSTRDNFNRMANIVNYLASHSL